MLKNNVISEKIKILRNKSLRKRREYDLNKPVRFWIKEDRLFNEIGKELTIILRTKGCSWALGEYGGCSMCGYVQDSFIENVDSQHLINQFDYALQAKLDEIQKDEKSYIIKIFNSGSFFDDSEVPESIRKHIYEKINSMSNIKEFIVESRLEYITKENLAEMRDSLKNKYCEIGIGLETTNDYIRNNYINKGISFNEFQTTLKLCHDNNIGVKAYLLFKPPFLNEQSAIDDCKNSINTLINNNVNSISINPVNIQKGSLTEYLWYQNRYRPPWFYSLINCLKKSLNQKDLNNTRILCDPSGAGTKRGIHNCLKRECNEYMKTILKKFVLNQDLNILKGIKDQCDCKILYQLQKDFW
jgi:radical SAM enzyme (TIGR01210 family)